MNKNLQVFLFEGLIADVDIVSFISGWPQS